MGRICTDTLQRGPASSAVDLNRRVALQDAIAGHGFENLAEFGTVGQLLLEDCRHEVPHSYFVSSNNLEKCESYGMIKECCS